MTLDDCPPILTAKEAAMVARCHINTIYKAVHSGELRTCSSGRLLRIHRDAIRDWVMGVGGTERRETPDA